MTLSAAHRRAAPSAIIDIGCNLADKQFASDVPEALTRASEANVSHILMTGTSISSTRNALRLIQEQRAQGNTAVNLTCTAGIHPHAAKDIEKHPNWRTELRGIVKQKPGTVKAIGECGLDYNRMFSPMEIQKQAFDEQMQLARELQLPAFLHCRDAFEDFVEVLSRYPDVRKCVHWYRWYTALLAHSHTDPDPTHLDALLALPGCAIGITGWVADDRRGRELAELVPRIPLDRLMIETDAPYLTPRNTPRPLPRRNEPALLPWVLRKVAECYGVQEKEIAWATTANAKKFFGLD